MELQTVRQVSLDYGISNRMLRYYEQIGLIKSSRIDDYAYRVYDEVNIKRLQQIIILRKLKISMKQIKNILNNQNAVAVIEIFKQNISELDEQITALSTVKSILEHFVDELQEKADVHLKLDLLNDKTMLAVVNALSFSENKIKEKVSMKELNRASETLSKFADSKVRIVNLPPMTVASLSYANIDSNSDEPYQKRSMNLSAVFKKFIDEVDLFNIKPDTRFFGEQYHEGHLEGDYYLWATIPDDLDVPAPFEKINFYGGLYAVIKGEEDLWDWLDNSDEYEWAPESGINRRITHEYFNMYNRYGFKDSYSEEIGFMYLELLIPIKETEKFTEEQKRKNTELEDSTSYGEPVKIDLTSMIKHGDIELKHTNGLMEIKIEGENSGHMETPQNFSAPAKIELRAKTDATDIFLFYNHCTVLINEAHKQDTLWVFDVGQCCTYKNCGSVPINKFVDIEWTIGREIMSLKINGELRHAGDHYQYIKALKENDLQPAPVRISTARGSTVTVESLRVTEI